MLSVLKYTAAVLLSGIVANEVIAVKLEVDERAGVFENAVSYSEQIQKPLLVIGTPKGKHACGDFTVDISGCVTEQCPVGGIILSAYDLDQIFYSKYFGAAVFSHVLEHLEEPEQALRKALGVSDRVYMAGPANNRIYSRLLNPEHISVGWWFDFKKRMVCPTCSTSLSYIAEVIQCEHCNEYMEITFG